VFKTVSLNSALKFPKKLKGVFNVLEPCEVIVDEVLKLYIKFRDFDVKFYPISVKFVLRGV